MNSITIKGLSKKYRIYDNSRARLKEMLLLGRKKCHRDFWAVRDLDLEVPKGQSLGIIGRNGAGKSTLLKLLTGVTSPTVGTVSTEGKVSAILELGAGFHPEFTGRDNVYMNAAILGIDKEFIDGRFDDILEFSELKDFIDVPVKFYSSGMVVRLGFSVAINVEPEILVIDEALAVGDMQFQKKCMMAMREFKRGGTTVILVSHSLADVGGFCDRTILMEGGRFVKDDKTDRVIEYYRKREQKEDESSPASVSWSPMVREKRTAMTTGEVVITGLEFINSAGASVERVRPGEKLVVKLSFDAKVRVANPVFRVMFYKSDGALMFGTNTRRRGMQLGELEGPGKLELVFDSFNLNFGRYFISVGVSKDEFSDFEASTGYDYRHMAYALDVERDFSQGGGIVYCPNHWRKA